MGFAKPCLDCGVLTRQGNRCQKHQNIIDSKINAKKQQRIHYKGDYRQRAKAVRDNAVYCWICGETFTIDNPPTADHLEPGNPDSILLPAHRSCNSSRGNTPARI